MATLTHEAPRERVDGETITTLPQAVRVFLSRPGPRLLIRHTVRAWLTRAVLGPPTLTELPVAAAAVVGWPFQEWLAHKYLLHMKPFTVRGVRVDPGFARAHRAHHRDLQDLDGTLLPMEVIRAAIPASAVFWTVVSLGSPRRAATGIATYSTMALLYEWTHFIVHTDVKPRTRFMRRVRRNHRLHHYRNENHWLSFTWPGVDRLLGTEPEPRTVPHSTTARRLFDLDE